MKLFILGESSGKPKDWSAWGVRALVLAPDLASALAMFDEFSVGAEVDTSEQGELMFSAPTNGL